MVSFYELKAQQPQGQQYDFSQLKGKVVLVVNTASKCGFTPQFEGLENLYKTYEHRGFQVIGFPCNQFMHQDPSDDAGIQEFCTKNYGVTFPMMAKSDVNGEHTNAVFRFLKHAKPGLLGSEVIKWNFTKFLVDKHGNVLERYSPHTKPEDIAKDIEKALAQ